MAASETFIAELISLLYILCPSTLQYNDLMKWYIYSHERWIKVTLMYHVYTSEHTALSSLLRYLKQVTSVPSKYCVCVLMFACVCVCFSVCVSVCACAGVRMLVCVHMCMHGCLSACVCVSLQLRSRVRLRGSLSWPRPSSWWSWTQTPSTTHPSSSRPPWPPSSCTSRSLRQR